MTYRAWEVGGLALGLVVALGGCKDDDGSISAEDAPEVFSESACEIYYGCGCETRPINQFSSQDNCELELAAALQSDIDSGEAEGLTYHGECVSQYISAVRALGCASLGEIVFDTDLLAKLDAVGSCKLFSGTQTAGQPCEALTDFDGDNCEADLRCEEGTCVVIAQRQPAGTACTDSNECEIGLACFDINGGTDSHCETLPAAGEQCKGVGDACALDSYCDQTDKTCRLLPGAGDACSPSPNLLLRRCELGSACENEQCVASPAGGESCTVTCAIGFDCQNGVCVESPPIACGLGAEG